MNVVFATSDRIKILQIQVKNDQVVFETICPQRRIGSKHEVAASAEDLTQTDKLLQLWPQSSFHQMFLLTYLATSQKPLNVNQVFGGHAGLIFLQILAPIAHIREIQPKVGWSLIEPPGTSWRLMFASEWILSDNVRTKQHVIHIIMNHKYLKNISHIILLKKMAKILILR